MDTVDTWTLQRKKSFVNDHFFSDNHVKTRPSNSPLLMTLSLSRHPISFKLVARASCLPDRKKSKIKASKKLLNKVKKIKCSFWVEQQEIFHIESSYNFNTHNLSLKKNVIIVITIFITSCTAVCVISAHFVIRFITYRNIIFVFLVHPYTIWIVGK